MKLHHISLNSLWRRKTRMLFLLIGLTIAISTVVILVNVSRALVNKPPLILADEPTGNLDTATSHSIMGLFRKLNEEGQTIVMVTHNPENLAYAGRFITLRDGKIAPNSKALKEPEIERVPIHN